MVRDGLGGGQPLALVTVEGICVFLNAALGSEESGLPPACILGWSGVWDRREESVRATWVLGW